MFRRSITLYQSARLGKKINPEYYLKDKVKSWVINSYGGTNELELKCTRIPVIRNPNDILVKVNAASINPIDLYMLGGYGRTLLQLPRQCELEFPLTLGRDFSGVVLAKGQGVDKSFNVGDEVYGFVPLHKQGSFTEVVLADKCHLQPKPEHLNDEECASLTYATMTAWSALFAMGNLLLKPPQGTRVLILGASGGVGTAAVQLLKSQGCIVSATCSNDAIPLVESLGADCVYDYRDKDFEENVADEGKYHIILDCAKFGIENISNKWKYDSFITLNSPLLVDTDTHGLFQGLLKSTTSLISNNLKNCGSGKSVKWAFFVPSASGFKFCSDLICDKKIRPVIHKIIDFENLPEAFDVVSGGHLRGKVVIKL